MPPYSVLSHLCYGIHTAETKVSLLLWHGLAVSTQISYSPQTQWSTSPAVLHSVALVAHPSLQTNKQQQQQQHAPEIPSCQPLMAYH